MEVRNTFFDLTLQIVLEQPFKIPFVAAVVVVLNGLNKGDEAVGGTGGILEKFSRETEARIRKGEWRDVKLLLRFLGSLQGILEEEGVFLILTELFERAVDLQTASSDDVSLASVWVYVLLCVANWRLTDTGNGACKGYTLYHSLHHGLIVYGRSRARCQSSG